MRHVTSTLLLAALAAGCATTPVKPPGGAAPDAREQLVARVNAEATGDARVTFDRQHRFTDRLVVERYRLSNGLVVIVMEDHSAPVFAYQTWFRVGSRNEREGITGIAHLFEHLLFKESENLGDGVFDKLLERNGGRVNASTWVDWTYYRENLPTGAPTLPADVPDLLKPPPADTLDMVVRLEADRMAHMIINKEQVEKEREVVKNERRFRVDNDPEGRMYEALYATAFSSHPYRWPTVGWMKDLDAITLEDCVDFYKTYYSPNNAVVVAVGDLDTERLLGLILARYGAMARQEIPPFSGPEEAAQEEERRKDLEIELSSPKVLVGYHIPALAHEDHPAIEVANEILFEGKSSRVHRRMVTREEVASEVSGWVSPFADPGLLEIMVTMKSGKGPKEGEAVLYEEIERLRTEVVEQSELAKAKNGLEAGFLRGLQDVGGKARNIGHYETTTGDHHLLFTQVSRYRAVSEEDVRRVARIYFARSNRTVLTANPAPPTEPAPAGTEVDQSKAKGGNDGKDG
jgi:zinc protease